VNRGLIGPARDDGSVPIPECVPDLVALVGVAAPRCGSTRLVCIDGPAGSGKTTLAGALAEALGDAPVVHMDDLYQGWAQALGEPLASRVEAWLLLGWEAGLPGMHPRFDWILGRYAEWVTVPVAPVVILEGCGSGSARIRERASLVVWVEAPTGLRLERGVERDGASLAPQWREWQAHEQAHFAADGTRADADVIVDGVSGRIQG
jgi:uridine kinase